MLKNVNVNRFSVFALGSSAYCRDLFAAFGRVVDAVLGKLGGQRILALGVGDELCGQEKSFNQWAENVFKVRCTFLMLFINLIVK